MRTIKDFMIEVEKRLDFPPKISALLKDDDESKEGKAEKSDRESIKKIDAVVEEKQETAESNAQIIKEPNISQPAKPNETPLR